MKQHSFRPFTTRDGSVACAECEAPPEHPIHQGYWIKKPCEKHGKRFNLECPACNGKNATWVDTREPK